MDWLEIKVENAFPENVDVLVFAELLIIGKTLIFPSKKKGEKVTFELERSSTRLQFKTDNLQAIRTAQDNIETVARTRNTEAVKPAIVSAFRKLRTISEQLQSPISLSTSRSDTQEKFIIRETTKLFENDLTWLKGRFYLYGEIQNVGGSSQPNIHLKTKKHKTVIIETTQDIIRKMKENKVYHKAGIEVEAYRSLETGEIKNHHAKFIRFLDYNPVKENDNIEQCIAQNSAEESFDTAAFVRELRGVV